jgi:hypothetical protein
MDDFDSMSFDQLMTYEDSHSIAFGVPSETVSDPHYRPEIKQGSGYRKPTASKARVPSSRVAGTSKQSRHKSPTHRPLSA